MRSRLLALCVAAGLCGATAWASDPGTGAADEDLYRRAMLALANGNNQAARSLLQQLLEQQPKHAGAMLDLALLACSLGQADDALRLFSEIEARFSPPPAIRELMNLQRERGCAASLPQAAADKDGALIAAAQAGRGWHSNVNQGVADLNVRLGGVNGPLTLQLLPEFGARSDGFWSWGAGLQGKISPAAGTPPWRWYVQLQGRTHDHATAFDVTEGIAGLRTTWQAGSFRGGWQAEAGNTTLGGQTYQRRALGHAWLHFPRMAPPGWTASGGLLMAREAYPQLPAFDSTLQEWRWRMERGPGSAVGSRQRGAVQLGWLRDTGSAQRPGGNRTGWAASAEGQHPLGAGLQAEWGLQRRYWQSSQPFAPGLLAEQRRQDTTVARAALAWSPYPRGRWLLEARHVRNQENIALFTYSATMVQLSYQHVWTGQPRTQGAVIAPSASTP